MNNLRQLRKSKGMTIRELGEATMISYAVLSYMENEERPFTQQNLETLCNYFHCTTDYMLGRSETKEAAEELEDLKRLTIQERYILDSIKGLTKAQLQELVKYIEAIKIRDALAIFEVPKDADL